MKIKIRVLLPLCLYTSVLFAQKLPKIQQESLRLPANMKVDGKSSEWNNTFQAYNKNTDIFYTMANDDDKLYLIIQATDPLVIRKIIAGSITFTVNPAGKKNDKDVSVTYPFFRKNNAPGILLTNKPIVTKDSIVSSKQVDSFMYVINKRLADKSKEIMVKGFKDMDTLISVYNQEGIKAASSFDHKIAYTYELAVPLKYLGLSIANQTKFNYTITLNGSGNIEGTTVEHIEGGTRINGSGHGLLMKDALFILDPTDFSGNYTLAKKPIKS